jgi:chondroitin AC lyase
MIWHKALKKGQSGDIMKHMRYRLFVILMVSLSFCKGALVHSDLATVRERVVAELLKPGIDNARIDRMIGTMTREGCWANIDYQDVSRTGFQHGRHLSNLVDLSRAYKKEGSTYRGDPDLKQVIHASLDFWLAHDFICDNWWWNQIGTPDALVSVLLIMEDDLTPEQKTKAAPMVGRAHLDASGARPSGDRIKIAGILAKHLLANRDVAQFNAVIKVIEGEIKFATGRGMQHDYSFHHRVDRVNNTLSYGTGYASAFVEWAVYVSGTQYAFSQEKLDHLVDYYLDGICKMMVHGKFPDPGAKNRSVSRQGSLHAQGPTLPERLMSTTNYRRAELEAIAKSRRGDGQPALSCSTFFWASEYFSVQRPDYFTSVRMFSTRNHNMEQPYNSEGLMNHHLADGSNFISRTGQEYYDIFPVLDWQKIPGTTVVQKPTLPSEKEIQKKGLTDFVGAVTDGTYGAAAFDFQSPHDPLTARKAWFFFDHEYVCLGAGITGSSEYPVATTLNQCLLKGDVTVLQGNRISILKPGERELNRVQWVFSDGVAYVFPEPVTVHVSNQEATGSWWKINHQSDSPKTEVAEVIFKLWLDHGVGPDSATYQYMVIPSINQPEIGDCFHDREIEILANSSDIQAVRHSGLGLCQAVFYRPGSLQISNGLQLDMTSPGLVMLKMQGDAIKAVTVSDPSRKLRQIHLTVTAPINRAGEDFKASWNTGRGVTEVSIDLPQTVYAGKSVHVELSPDG